MAGQSKKDPWAQFSDAPGSTIAEPVPTNSADTFGNFADASGDQQQAQHSMQAPSIQPAQPTTSNGDAALSGWKSGALLGFDDEIGGAGAAGGNWLVNNVLTSDAGQKFAPYIAALLGKGYDPNWRFNDTGQSAGQAYEAERAKEEAHKNQAWQENPGYYMAGFAPGMVASAMVAPEARVASGETALGRTANAMANGAMYGAASGAGNAQPGERLSGAATGAAIGSVAAPIGNALARGVANVISPTVAPIIARLQAEGIPLTPGQILGASGGAIGRGLRSAEEIATSVPGLGAVIKGAQTRGVEALNRAGINKVLAPIEESLPKEVPVGPTGVKYAGDQLSGAYKELMPKLAAKADDQFLNDMSGVAERMDTMVGPRAEQFANIMNSDVRRFFKDDGSINGLGLKDVESRLGARIRTMMSSPDADQRDMGIALRAVQEAVRDLAARQNPAQAARLRAINEGWAMLTRIEGAGAKGNDSGFSPGNLRQAVKEGDRTVRKRGFARGDALMQQFADDAYNVLPNKTPDSGTAGRGLLGMLLTGQLVLGPKGVAAAGAAAAPYTKTGGKVAEWLLTGRQGPAAKAIANGFRTMFKGGGAASGDATVTPGGKGPSGGAKPAAGYPKMDPDGQTVWLSDSVGIPAEVYARLPAK